jgi:hypothetical protein
VHHKRAARTWEGMRVSWWLATQREAARRNEQGHAHDGHSVSIPGNKLLFKLRQVAPERGKQGCTTRHARSRAHQWLQMNMIRVAGAPAAYSDSLIVLPVRGSSSCKATSAQG